MSKSDTGKIGEDIATQYLKNKEYSIIERNFREKWGELDIITIAPDKTLVFIEVKTIGYKTSEFENASENLLSPESNLTKSKLTKLQRTASLYVGAHQELIKDKMGWRIDLVSIRMFAGKHPYRNKIDPPTHFIFD